VHVASVWGSSSSHPDLQLKNVNCCRGLHIQPLEVDCALSKVPGTGARRSHSALPLLPYAAGVPLPVPMTDGPLAVASQALSTAIETGRWRGAVLGGGVVILVLLGWLDCKLLRCRSGFGCELIFLRCERV